MVQILTSLGRLTFLGIYLAVLDAAAAAAAADTRVALRNGLGAG